MYSISQVRQFISDFAVIIAILSMTFLDWYVGIPTPKLQVPSDFKPTLESRGWLVSPFGRNPVWSGVAAVLPALLGTILIFMDQQITAVIVNRKENKLKASIFIIFPYLRPLIFCLDVYEFTRKKKKKSCFVITERVWIPLRLICPCSSYINLLHNGTSLVRSGNGSFYKSRQFAQAGI